MKYFALILICIATAFCGPIEDWSRFEKDVRDQRISKDSLKVQIPKIIDSLKKYASTIKFEETNQWIFPLKGGSLNDVGWGGFKPDSYYGNSPIKGYDFFDGNRHGGHPAYDMFIRDKNQDSRDDLTGRPVEVVAPEDLLVISVNTNWTDTSIIRGGNYVWGFIPSKELLVYFAHLDSIYTRSGEVLRAGQSLGTIGRTGKSAREARSPTHLHMMALHCEKGTLKPVDFMYFLKSIYHTPSE
jgi:hypothetical protein